MALRNFVRVNCGDGANALIILSFTKFSWLLFEAFAQHSA